ncbi:hypothetical protein EPI10_002850 [Gossypium australe]|uniref:Uncharacterized protein n=1 Tax=Gossypium australe TaxID=47621 RepID=A0A5B6VFH5_9ROSI|nr:hypothetical protein EPI10_002850 [Gossypium australe]
MFCYGSLKERRVVGKLESSEYGYLEKKRMEERREYVLAFYPNADRQLKVCVIVSNEWIYTVYE